MKKSNEILYLKIKITLNILTYLCVYTLIYFLFIIGIILHMQFYTQIYYHYGWFLYIVKVL